MSIVDRTNYLFSGITVIIAFWGLFWLLNGLDKYFNGTFEPNINSYATKYVAVPVNEQNSILFIYCLVYLEKNLTISEK